MSSRSPDWSDESSEAAAIEKDGARTIIFDPFFRRASAIIGLAAAVVVLLLFLWKVSSVLLLVFAGGLFGVVLHGFARRMSDHTPFSYGWSLLITCLLLVWVLVMAVWLIAPQVAQQVGELRNVLPQSIDRLEQQLNEFGWGEFLVDRVPEPRDMMSGGRGFWSQVTGILSSAVGILLNFLLILVFGIYFAINPGLYKRGLVRLVPQDKEKKARATLQALGQSLWQWLIGQFISMAIIGVLVWVGLSIVGIPLALGLGFIAGLTEFVPLIGPWVGAIPGLLVALIQGPTTMLYAALVYLGVQQLESNLITPLVMKKAVALPPALTISATLIGGALFGIPGILLATPLMVAIMVLVEKIYIEGVLGKKSEGVQS